MHAISVPGLSTQQNIECIVEGSLICKRIGMNKKYSFLLYIAGLISAEGSTNNNGGILLANKLFFNLSKNYGIEYNKLVKKNISG